MRTSGAATYNLATGAMPAGRAIVEQITYGDIVASTAMIAVLTVIIALTA